MEVIDWVGQTAVRHFDGRAGRACGGRAVDGWGAIFYVVRVMTIAFLHKSIQGLWRDGA